MFLAAEARIAERRRLVLGYYEQGHSVVGLTDPLFALRVLSGKSYVGMDDKINYQLLRLIRDAKSEINTPANHKLVDHTHWPVDWDGAPMAARIRVLSAKALSFAAGGITIIDR